MKTYTSCLNTFLTLFFRGGSRAQYPSKGLLLGKSFVSSQSNSCKNRNCHCAVDHSIMLFIKCCGGIEPCHPSVSNQQRSWQRKVGCIRMHWHRPFKLAYSGAWTWQWFLKLIYLLFAGKGYHFETYSKSFQFQDMEESNTATSILMWFPPSIPFAPATELIRCHFIPCHGYIFFFFCSFPISVFKIESSPNSFPFLNTTCSSF